MYGSGRSEPLPPPRAPLGVMSGLVLQGDATVVHSAPELQEGLSRTGKESLRINRFNKFNMLQTTEPSPLYCTWLFCPTSGSIFFGGIFGEFSKNNEHFRRGFCSCTAAHECWESQFNSPQVLGISDLFGQSSGR